MDDTVDETMVLLPKSKHRAPTRTPLPKRQLTILMLVHLCEPLANQSIFPYINELVSELEITGGDERKVGYYAGLVSLFFMVEAFTVLHWSRASDRFGRKPILLIGLCGTFCSMISFGLSRTFWALVFSRCFTGLLNGNIGVMKSAIGDLTDPSNRAAGFACIAVVWDVGAALAPLLGGFLTRPQDHFPRSFSGTFWKQFPYFLPCVAVAGYVLLACILALAFLDESNLHRKGSSLVIPDACGVNLQNTPFRKRRSSPPVRELLTFPVVISISNYASLAFLFISISALLPLLLAMPIELGGLGLPPAQIGLILSVYSAATALFQGLFCAKLLDRFGSARVFIGGMSMCLPTFALFPVISIVVQRTGLTSVVWFLVGCVLAFGALVDTCFGAIFTFVNAAAPTGSRGTVNGMAQTAVSLTQSLGPAVATALFSFSLEMNLLNGYAVYVVFVCLSAMAMGLAMCLPAQLWELED